MTRDEVLKDPGYLRLTEQQKALVVALIDNGGDKVEAALTAYKCKDRYSAVSVASKCLRHPVISRLAKMYFGDKLEDRVPQQREFGALMFAEGQSINDPKVALEFFKLSAKVLGYDQEPPKEPAPKGAAPAENDALVAELEARGLRDAKQPASK